MDLTLTFVSLSGCIELDRRHRLDGRVKLCAGSVGPPAQLQLHHLDQVGQRSGRKFARLCRRRDGWDVNVVNAVACVDRCDANADAVRHRRHPRYRGLEMASITCH